MCIYLFAGIALLGINTDIFEARALILNNSIVDIYSNSWGPSDYGGAVIGPGPVTQLALESGAQEVFADHFVPALILTVFYII